jgi:hypothetical protein
MIDDHKVDAGRDYGHILMAHDYFVLILDPTREVVDGESMIHATK